MFMDAPLKRHTRSSMSCFLFVSKSGIISTYDVQEEKACFWFSFP